MAKNNDNMNKKLIIIVLVIAIVALVAFLITRMRDRNLIDYSTSEDFSNYYAAETIRPRNLGELYGYSGQLELNDLYMSMRSFVNYIGRLKIKLNDVNDAEELKKFFSDNKDEIKTYTSITEEEYFLQFVDYLKQNNVEEDFKYAEVIAGSSYLRFNYYWVEMNFYFGNAEKPVYFNVGLATKSTNKTPVKFTMESNNTEYESEEAKKYKNELLQNDRPGGNAEY